MNWEQHISDNRRDLDQNQIRQMVKESYYDIEAGKGRDCRDFFCELEKGLVDEENMVLKSRASERLLAILKEGEDSAEEKGWITADEVKVKLEHNRRKAPYQ